MGCEYFDNFLFYRGGAETQCLLKDKKIEKLYIEYLLISKTNKNFIKQEVCRQLRERS